MEKLTPVYYTYRRFPNEVEKEREQHIIKEGMVSLAQMGHTKLKQDYTITLAEAREIYERIVKAVNPKEGEQILRVKFDLTKYFEYHENGTPMLADEEYPVSHDRGEEITATYNAEHNKLMIWRNGLPIYENRNGIICEDGAALADSYL